MTKGKEKIDNGQLSLLDLLTHDREERIATIPGRLCVSARLLAAVKYAIKQAPKSRETLADEMTELLGVEVSVHMINAWCADSHPHRLPAEFLPALCSATGSTAPLRIMAEAAGLFALEGPDALRSEMQHKLEAKRVLDKEIRRTEALIRALEGER